MYFESRGQAGQLLAQQLIGSYRYEDVAVVALGAGAVLVGEQIAAELHCVLTMLVTQDIAIPGENIEFGAVSQGGQFTYNADLSAGEIAGYTSEFHGYLSEQKREAFQTINRLVGDGGTIDVDLLYGRIIIVVSDGLCDASEVSAALDFLKPVFTKRLIVAAPIATVPLVDVVHVRFDEMHILDVKENYISTEHYYDDNTIPSMEETVAHISRIITRWR